MCSFPDLSEIDIENKNKNLTGGVWREIRHFHLNKQFVDVVIIADANGERFPCHRLVLASCSEFFKALFTSPKYAAQNEFTLREVHGKELKQLLNFCYGMPMRVDLGSEMKGLLSAAFLLKFEAAVTACIDYFNVILSPNTALGIYLLAEQFDLYEVRDRAQKIIYADFVMICETEEFLQLTPEQLKPLIGSDKLVVPSEEFVFNSVKQWFRYNTDRVMKLRGYEIDALLWLDHLTQDFLSKNRNVERINIYETDSDNDELSLGVRPIQHNLPTKSKRVDLLAVFRKGDKLKLESYNPSGEVWSSVGQIGTGKILFVAAIAILNDKLILVGGKAEGQTDIVLSFDLKKKTSTQLSAMQTPRFDFGLCIFDGLCYAVGGHYDGKTLNAVERYDQVANKWSSVASMKHRRSGVGVAVLLGRLYAVGGQEYDDHKFAHSIESYCSTECYDPRTNEWLPRAYMNRARSQHGLAAFNGFLYAVGGRAFANLRTVERYDPNENKWTLICPLNSPECIISCVDLGDGLMAINRETGMVQKYDVKRHNWVKVTQCPGPVAEQWHVVPMPI